VEIAEGFVQGNIGKQQHPDSAYSITRAGQCTSIRKKGPSHLRDQFCFWEQIAYSAVLPPTIQSNRAVEKKEEFTGLMVTWCLGTPFPRSALFLKRY
jgi:hypothetical protein